MTFSRHHSNLTWKQQSLSLGTALCTLEDSADLRVLSALVYKKKTVFGICIVTMCTQRNQSRKYED